MDGWLVGGWEYLVLGHDLHDVVHVGGWEYLVLGHDLHDVVHEGVQVALGACFAELAHQVHGRCLGAVHILDEIIPLQSGLHT